MLSFTWPALKTRPAEPRLAAPTPTLRLLAGDHADAVARVWPPPHAAYLVMPAQRRHLAHVVLATTTAPRAALAEALEHARADAVARAYLGPMPTGFVRALGRLGELAWAGADYMLLLSLFEDERAGVFLRQAAQLSPEATLAVAALSPPLRAVAIARHVETPALAGLLDEAWRAVVAVHGPAVAAGIALARWSRAADARRLFAMAAADVTPFDFDLAPYPGAPGVRRLATLTSLEDAGRRFRNCLAAYRDHAADGSMALFEWEGPPPTALALRRDGFFGWRLEQARGVDNDLLDGDARARLTALLEGLGVRVGSSGATLRARLLRAAGEEHGWIDDQDTALAPFGL